MAQYLTKKIQKEHKGRVYTFDIGVRAENVETDEDHQFLTKREKEGMVSKEEPIDNKVRFTAAINRENIVDGETIPKIMGKICRILGDLLEAGTGFRGVTDAVNRGMETDVVSRKALEGVDCKLGGVSFEQEGEDIYAVYQKGADTVRKKLGSGMEAPFKNVLVGSLPSKSVKNINKDYDGYMHYGNLSIFDLTMLQGYEGFVFGSNIIAVPCTISQTQDGVSNTVALIPHKKLMHNIDAPIGDDVSMWEFGSKGPYAPPFDPDDEGDYIVIPNYQAGTIYTEFLGNINYFANMALYCPGNGKLYCVCANTSTIVNISLYKV